MEQKEKYMREAIRQAKKAAAIGEVVYFHCVLMLMSWLSVWMPAVFTHPVRDATVSVTDRKEETWEAL